MSDDKKAENQTTKILITIVVAMVLGGGGVIARTVSKVTALEPRIEQIKITQEINSKWIA